MSTDIICTHVVFCLPPVTNRQFIQRPAVRGEGSRVTFSAIPFGFTLLSKNAFATHLESHSCKNKGLKVPCFHTLTKKGVGEGSRISCFDFRVSSPNFRLSSVDYQLSRVSPLTSALTSKRAPKSFRCNTYEKHTGGEGGPPRVSNFAFRISIL